MRKIHLIELAQDHLSGGDAPDDVRGKYHPEIISNLLALAFNEVVMQTYLEAKAYSDYSVLDAWAKNHTVSISSSSVALPFPPVQLPNGMGILQVADSSDPTATFAYRETNANSAFNALEVNNSNKPYFYLEQNAGAGNNSHVLIVGNVGSITEVKVKMIVPFDQIDYYDEMAIPTGKEKNLIDYVIVLLRDKKNEDVINDNKANQT